MNEAFQGLECSNAKIPIPVREIAGAKTNISVAGLENFPLLGNL